MGKRFGLGRGPLGSMPLGGFVEGLQFIIDGQNRSNKIDKQGLRITDVLTSQVDFAVFVMKDLAQSEVPSEGQEVIISQGKERMFGGIIATVERKPIGPNDDMFQIRVQDFSKLFEKRLVTRVFNTPTKAGDIIKTILNDFVSDVRIGQDLIQDGPTIDFISFNFTTALNAIKQIAKETGFDWFIDGFKRLNYFNPTTSAAPFNIVPGELRYRQLRIRPDSSQLRNRIVVKGGTQPSDPFSEEYLGDTKRTTFPVSHPPTEVPVVKVNGVPKTVGEKNTDEGTKDFSFDPNDLIIENDQAAILTTSDTLTLEYSFKVPILVQVEDSVSIAAVAAVEGSDGIYEHVISDDTLGTLESAKDRGRAELRRFSNALFTGSFETHIDGFRSGQQLSLNFPEKSIALTLLIIKVVFKSIGCGRGFYRVQFGSFSHDFQDFLLELFNRGRKIAVREGEVLDDLVSMLEEATITDADLVFVDGTPVTKWGPDANAAVWNLSQWS